MPTILAVESATDACSVALLVNGDIEEDFRVEPRRHTRLLLPMIDALLRKCDIDVHQLDAIAFSAGPGSFTGLRVCAGTVQGLAFAAACSVIPLSTLAILAQTCVAQHHLDEGARVLASLDARMDEVYWGDYHVARGLVEARDDDRLLAPTSVSVDESCNQAVVAVGSGWQYRESFSMASAPHIVDVSMLPRAKAMLPLAERAWSNGMAVSPDQAIPIYLRESVAWKQTLHPIKEYRFMDPIQAIILALIQGLTEFLPISSSGHLILPQTLLGWQDQGLAFDVAVHIGSLVAVISYFRRDVVSLLSNWSSSVVQRREVGDSRLAWLVILATMPAVLAGLLFNDVIEQHLRSAAVLATTTLVFGLLLGLGDYSRRENRTLADIGIGVALLVGLAQAIALVPGTSRSGITITAALLLGLGRADAARFSFLLSMPIIAAAGCYKLLELLQGSGPVAWGNLALGFAVSALSAYLCIAVFMQWIERVGMMPFVIYRIVLAAVIVVVAMP